MPSPKQPGEYVHLPELPMKAGRPPLTKADRRFLDDLERSVRSISHPVDNAAVFHLQVQYTLDRDGFYVIREVPMTGKRRVDLVVVRQGITCAVELDRFNPLRRSFSKFADLPGNILRVVVLRRRTSEMRLAWADRTVCMRSTLKMVSWLCDGHTTDMSSIDEGHRRRSVVIPLREHLLVQHKAGTLHGGRR